MSKLKVVTNVVDYIENNIESSIKIIDIVQYSGYSRRYIELLFQEYSGSSLGAYIRSRKLTRACLYLRLTRMPISRISLSLKFSSQQNFSREFKKFSGYTPYQYRKKEFWDLSVLKKTISIHTPPLPPLIVVSLNKTQIFGYEISYDVPIPHRNKDDKGTVHRWNSLLQQLNFYKKTMVLITTYKPSLNSYDLLRVTTKIGVLKSSDSVSKISYAYESGKYAKFEFTGPEDKYTLFHQNIYLNVLPFYKIKRREGHDIEIFHFNESDLTNKNLKVDYYIPLFLDCIEFN